MPIREMKMANSRFAVWDFFNPQGFNRNGSDFQLFDFCVCFRCLVLHLIGICAPNFIANSKLAFEFKKSCPITKKILANTHFTYWVSWTAFDTSGPSFGVEQSPVMNFWKHSGKLHLNLRNNKHLLRVGHSFLSTATAGASLRWGEARPGNSMKNETCTIFNYSWNKLLPYGDQIATVLLASGGFLGWSVWILSTFQPHHLLHGTGRVETRKSREETGNLNQACKCIPLPTMPKWKSINLTASFPQKSNKSIHSELIFAPLKPTVAHTVGKKHQTSSASSFLGT